MGSTGGGTYGSTRRGITIRKDIQLGVDSMPCRGSDMTQIPLLLTVRGEGWEQHVAVKSHLGKAEFKQQKPMVQHLVTFLLQLCGKYLL